MTNIRAGVGGARAQQVQALQQPQQAQKAQAPQKKKVEEHKKRVVTQDDRHGAAARAFDGGTAQVLQQKVGARRDGAVGFGQNLGQRPLRSAPGAPSPAAWANAGHGVLAHVTAHPPIGRIEPGQSFMRVGAAAVLGAVIMAGVEPVARLCAAVATHPSDRLPPELRAEIQGAPQALRTGRAEFGLFVKLQTAIALASSRTQEFTAMVREALRPPMLNALAREQRDQLRLYERMLQNHAVLDPAQCNTLSHLLTTARGAPTPVLRAWDPALPAGADKRTLRVWLAPPGAPPAELFDPDIVAFCREARLLRGDVTRVEAPPPGEPLRLLAPLLDELGAGSAAVVQTHLTDHADDAEASHFVLLGRRGDGTAYLYNPDPRGGDFTVLFGRVGRNQPAEFTAELTRYQARIRDDVDGDPPVVFRVVA